MSDQKTPDDMTGEVRVRRFVAFLAILMILIGELVLTALPVREEIVIPPYLWLCLIGVVLFLASQLLRPAAFAQRWFSRFPGGRAPWIAAALIFSALAGVSAVMFRLQGRTNLLLVTTVWFASAACYMVAFRPRFPAFSEAKTWLKSHRNELLMLAVVVLLGIALRFSELGSVPRVLDGDEGRMGLAAQSTTSTRLANPFALYENFGGLYLQLSNLALFLFGSTPFALRLLPAISGVLAIPAIYLFARQIAGQRVALLTAILLTVSHAHIHFSRIASVGYIHDTWLVPLEFFLLLRGIEKRSSWQMALAGLLLAFHFSIYLTAQIILGIIITFMLLAVIFLRPWLKAAAAQVAAFWGGFAILIIPEAVYIFRQPNEFFNRLTANGSFQTGWLTQTAALTGKSIPQILIERVIHAFLSLIYYPAFDFYGSPYPVLSAVATVLFLIGLGIALTRTRVPGFLLLNGYFWGCTVAIGVFAIPPSADSYRMLLTLPAALLMASLALEQVLNLFGLGWSASRSAYALSAGAVMLSLLIFNLWAYYGDFARQCRFGNDLQGRFASYLGEYAGTISNASSIYLLSDEIFFYGSYGSTDFLRRGRVITNFPGPMNTLNAARGETIIATPPRIEELETWARAHSGGELHYEYDCRSPILLAYQVP